MQVPVMFPAHGPGQHVCAQQLKSITIFSVGCKLAAGRSQICIAGTLPSTIASAEQVEMAALAHQACQKFRHLGTAMSEVQEQSSRQHIQAAQGQPVDVAAAGAAFRASLQVSSAKPRQLHVGVLVSICRQGTAQGRLQFLSSW